MTRPYVHVGPLPGDALAQTSSPAPDVADLNGESLFDLRIEAVMDYGTRVLEDSSGVLYLAVSTSGVLSARMYDGTSRLFTCDTALPDTGWWQARAVLDGTSDPMTGTFYYRAVGPELDNDSGWTQIGSVGTIAGSFSGQSVTSLPYNIGARAGTYNGALSVRRAFVGYGASNTAWINVDMSNLSDAEVGAGEFVDNAGIGWELPSDAWAYVPRTVTSFAGKTPELLLRAEDYQVGNPKWPDVSGNDHHAQFGSAAGADTNDPVFKAYDGTQYLYLPGSSGNYASTADVNLLDADTAHGQQGDGVWTSFTNNTVVQDDTYASLFALGGWLPATTHKIEYRRTDQITVSTSQPTGTNAIPCSPSTQYTVSVYAYVPVGGDLAWGRFRIRDYDSGGTLGSNLLQAFQAIPAGTLTQIEYTFTTASDAAYVSINGLDFATTESPATITSDQDVWFGNVCLRAGSDGTFVPSIRIVGDLEIEVEAETADWSPSSTMQLVSNRPFGDTDYRIFMNASFLYVQANTGSSRLAGFANPPTGRHTLKAVIDVSSGDISLSIDGGTATTVASGVTGATTYSGSQLGVGASPLGLDPFSGDIYSVTVRDGIDGPIVAKYDATEAVEPFATQTDSETGRTWSYNRSASGYVATVVDRDMFLLSTDDYFVVPDADGLDSAADEDITLIAVARTPDNTPSAHRTLVAKGLGGGGWYMLRETNSSGAAAFLGDDGAGATRYSATTQVPQQELYVMAGRRDGTNGVSTFLDGVEGTPLAATSGDWSNAFDFYIGARRNTGDTALETYYEGQIIAVALFREALTDQEIADVGAALTASYDVSEAALLHGDALWDWMLAQPGVVALLSTTDTELVGALNELNGTDDVEYAEARGTFLGIDPAG